MKESNPIIFIVIMDLYAFIFAILCECELSLSLYHLTLDWSFFPYHFSSSSGLKVIHPISDLQVVTCNFNKIYINIYI